MTAAYVLSDMLVLARRSLMRVRRQPDLLVGYTVQPIMFVLLFLYVFGGAIQVPGLDYVDFLMPGIIIQSMVFGGFVTALGLSDDLKKGLIDRFRSLPMARSAVLSGRTFADVIYTLGILVVLMLSGLVVGWRVHSSLGDFLLAVALMIFFTYAMAWVGVYLGLVAPTVETVQQLGFLIIFPLTFLSNAFVPTETLPAVLQPIAEWNPISAVTTALRDLFGNAPVPDGAAWPVAHPVAGSLAWCAVLLAVFVPLAVRTYAAGPR